MCMGRLGVTAFYKRARAWKMKHFRGPLTFCARGIKLGSMRVDLEACKIKILCCLHWSETRVLSCVVSEFRYEKELSLTGVCKKGTESTSRIRKLLIKLYILKLVLHLPSYRYYKYDPFHGNMVIYIFMQIFYLLDIWPLFKITRKNFCVFS